MFRIHLEFIDRRVSDLDTTIVSEKIISICNLNNRVLLSFHNVFYKIFNLIAIYSKFSK